MLSDVLPTTVSTSAHLAAVFQEMVPSCGACTCKESNHGHRSTEHIMIVQFWWVYLFWCVTGLLVRVWMLPAVPAPQQDMRVVDMQMYQQQLITCLHSYQFEFSSTSVPGARRRHLLQLSH